MEYSVLRLANQLANPFLEQWVPCHMIVQCAVLPPPPLPPPLIDRGALLLPLNCLLSALFPSAPLSIHCVHPFSLLVKEKSLIAKACCYWCWCCLSLWWSLQPPLPHHCAVNFSPVHFAPVSTGERTVVCKLEQGETWAQSSQASHQVDVLWSSRRQQQQCPVTFWRRERERESTRALLLYWTDLKLPPPPRLRPALLLHLFVPPSVNRCTCR